jgi:hypothetical protein
VGSTLGGFCKLKPTIKNDHGMSWLWIIVAVPLWWFTLVGFLQAADHHKNDQEMSWLGLLFRTSCTVVQAGRARL